MPCSPCCSGRPPAGSRRRARGMAVAVGQPGLLHGAGRQPERAGTARHGSRDDGGRARLAGVGQPGRRRPASPPGPPGGRDARRAPRRDRGGDLSAGDGGPGHGHARGRGGTGDLGRRAGSGRHPGRAGHGRELRAPARPARAGLLAAQRRAGRGGAGMIRPLWLGQTFAAVVVALALFSIGRLIVSRRRGRPGELDGDGVHILMGVAMTGMFVPRLAVLPIPAWEMIFAAGAAWFGWRAVQVRRPACRGTGYLSVSGRCCRYPLPHLVDCAAMLYALWAVPVLRSEARAPGGMSGVAGAAGGTRLPALGLVLALCICGYVVWLGDRLPPTALARAAVDAREPVSAGPVSAAAAAATGMA